MIDLVQAPKPVCHIARNILTARMARRMTQQTLAELVRVVRTTLFQWEQDAPESGPNHRQIMALGEALEVHPERLMFEDPELFRRSFAVPPRRARQEEPEEPEEAPRRGKAKLSPETRAEMFTSVEERGESARAVARRFGVNESTVRRVCIEMRAANARRPPNSRISVPGDTVGVRGRA